MLIVFLPHEEAHRELGLSRHIASANLARPGLKYIRLVQGSFTIPGSDGVALVSGL